MAYYDTYRDQLANLYRGHALWVPDPAGLYDRVRVGDVGYVKQGHFLRMFNALLPHNDTAQVYGVPDGFVPLNMGPFQNIRTLNLQEGDYCSTTVTVDHGLQADSPEDALFRCRRNNKGGAFLSLPFHAVSEDAIRTKAFETYIRKHCDSWLEFAILNELDVRLEDIILVTGCDLLASWAMAVYMNPLDPEITLRVQRHGPLEAGSAEFQWSHTSQPHHNEPNQNTVKSHCVFLRGFRAKRILPFFKTLRAAAGPRPDNPDNEPESSIELLREPTIPDYRDPLIGILDYIAEQRPHEELALAHEDDLKIVEGVDVLTADAVENFLRQNEIPLQSEKGVALLADDDEEGVPEEEKMTFHAHANLNVSDEPLPLIVHPALKKYLLKFDITQPPDHDFGLPSEEFTSSAVHPPVLILILENEQGLPQNIEVHASDKGSVTVEDVLKSIGADLRKSSSQREWAALNEDVRREVEDAFEDRATTEEERSGGLRRMDYLRGRNRLQVFPRHAFSEEEEEIAQPAMPFRPSDLLEIAGPSTAPLRTADKGKARAG